ncbi:hypothetical protein GHT06_020761 [Daphnia sinensis]|uniref:Uncharacterized protein n=1 Tax=Daphnia sinensis TaxID=1820382 RepID=A0AAD5KJI5_9CRUS|nr:hypothetical protein GHT06_020761 [Daphnia sinensis]
MLDGDCPIGTSRNNEASGVLKRKSGTRMQRNLAERLQFPEINLVDHRVRNRLVRQQQLEIHSGLNGFAFNGFVYDFSCTVFLETVRPAQFVKSKFSGCKYDKHIGMDCVENSFPVSVSSRI